MRGRGWRSSYPLGSQAPAPGLPIIAGSRWDTGIQARVAGRASELAVSWTVGSLSTPGFGERHGSGTWAARARGSRGPGLSVGISGARGTFVDADALDALSAGSRRGGVQQTLGVDVEWVRDQVQVRGEALVNRWTVPTAVASPLPLDSHAVYVEARYRFHPRVYAAARAERLGFGRIGAAPAREPWEARVSRVEAGGGVSLAPRTRVKLAYQQNVRDGGRVRRSHLLAAQVVVWF